MLIDVNAYIGHWPFRQLRITTAEGLVREMDRQGIDRAVAANLHGVFYQNVQPANEELAEAARPFGDRLIPFATLNPAYPGWEEDLRRCEGLGLRGLRLYPQYHGYQLAGEAALALVDAAARLGWAVQAPMRLVDRRGRHPMDLGEDLSPANYEAAIGARPNVHWMILAAAGLDGRRLPPEANYAVEISRLTAVLRRDIQRLLEGVGPRRVVWGTGMPLNMAAPALLRLQALDVEAEVKERIAWRNAAEMLGLVDGLA